MHFLLPRRGWRWRRAGAVTGAGGRRQQRSWRAGPGSSPQLFRQVLWASSSCRSPCLPGALYFPGSASSLACCILVQPASPESPPLALPPEPVPCLPASLHAAAVAAAVDTASYLLVAFSLRPLPTLAPRYPFPPLLFIHLSTRSAREILALMGLKMAKMHQLLFAL